MIVLVFSNFIAVEEVRMASPVPVCTTTCTICLSVQLFVVIFGESNGRYQYSYRGVDGVCKLIYST